ncbi:H-NS histone family protein [Marinobacterium jannaschii]|uniref:H-NS histone family protein n=1 Tax=Marinobacterium jannaschii TaxID=64970 RepID=UPI00048355CF|nr:H-NS histone family protein [Marinobacterium jannaschii]
MSDFVKTLTRKNSLRKQCQTLSLAELEKVIGDLTEIVDEKRAEEEAREAAEQEKVSKIEEIRLSMLEAGINMDDLVGSAELTPRKKVQPKYRIVDDEGETHEWSGRGRTPVAFQQFFAKGNSKEDCLIK